jgi:large subunit ribosomal protein L10
LPFKGGLMDGAALDPEQIRSLSRLPSREVLYGQLVGVVASPISGLVRSLGGLLGGLAVALGQVREKKESGEIPAGDAPAAAVAPEPAAEAPPTESTPEPEAPVAEAPAENQTEPEDKPAQADDQQADVSAETQSEDAETNPTKED